MTTAEPRVCLAISSFRNDDCIEALLRAHAERRDTPFEHIFVVDSLGTGRIEGLLREAGWTHVTYYSAPLNLGSAGNLATRLRLAAEAGYDFAYAINHDADVDLAALHELLRFARGKPRLGALYPLRYLTARGRYDVTGTQKAPLPLRGAASAPTDESLEVSWSSSNGALYALDPVRDGLLPWADLWMGWEDMGYGWLLERHRYQQFIVTRARALDNYEYRAHRVLSRHLYLTEKPAWYAYYQARNLILITRRNRRPARDYAVVAARIAQEVVLTTVLRPEKRKRYELLFWGLIDGVRNRSGKWRVP